MKIGIANDHSAVDMKKQVVEIKQMTKLIRYNIFRKLKNEQKDRHAQKTLVE